MKYYLFLFITICLVARFSHGQSQDQLSINKYVVECSGEPYHMFGQGVHHRYGIAPNLIVRPVPNTQDEYVLAWLNQSSRKVEIIRLNGEHKVIKTYVPQFLPKTGHMAGFDVLPNERFVLGYTKDNQYGDKNFEYWVTLFDEAGDPIFNKLIFGDLPSDSLGAKGRPVDASSARILYNSVDEQIYVYLGHTQKYSDGLRHQGGYLSKLSLDGEEKIIDRWFVSHNFDVRMVTEGSKAYPMYHGDAYPRALGIGVVDGKSFWGVKQVNFLDIEGRTGDNNTGVKLGGFVSTGKDQLFTTFLKKGTDGYYKTGFASFGFKKGKLASSKVNWLKNPGKNKRSSGMAMLSKLPSGRLLAGYEVFDKSGYVSYKNLDSHTSVFYELAADGRVISGPIVKEGIRMQARHEMIQLGNGNIIWAVVQKTSSTEFNFLVYEVQHAEKLKSDYERYSTDEYDRLLINDKAYLVQKLDLKKDKKILLQVGRRLCEKGETVELFAIPESGNLKYRNLTINSVGFKFKRFTKWNEKSFTALKQEIRKSSKNHVFYFKKEVTEDQISELKKSTLSKIQDLRTYYIIAPNEIYFLQTPLDNE